MITETRDIQAIVLSVAGIQGRGTAGNRWEVALNDGNTYVTWEPNLGNKAYGLANQQGVTARVTLKPSKDGKFQNYYLDDIAGPGEHLPPSAMPVNPGTPAAPAAPTQQPAQPPQQAPVGAAPIRTSKYTPEEEALFARKDALARAVELAAGLFAGVGPEASIEADTYIRAKTEEYLSFIQTGLWTPQEAVAAQVNAVAGDGAVQVGASVPWDQQPEQAAPAA